MSLDPIAERLQRLQDVDTIHSLKARYCRYVDTKQWTRLRELFSADARFDGFGSAPPGADVDTFVAGVSARLRDTTSVHHCHQPELRFHGPDRARGVWAMMDYVQWPPGQAPKETPGSAGFFGYGHYEEEYRREGNTWRITQMRLTRIRFDALPAQHPAPRAGMLRHDPNWLDEVY